MQKGPRYEVQTKYGWFSLDEASYRDYLAGKLWIAWPPERTATAPKQEVVPKNVSRHAVELREMANGSGVCETMRSAYPGECPALPNVERLAELAIDELCLSVRASNGLMRAGIRTFGKLAATLMREGGLFTIRNLGAKSEKEIRAAYIEECYLRMTAYEKAVYWQSFLDAR